MTSKSFERVVAAFQAAGLIVKMRGQDAADAQAPGHSAKDQSVSIRAIEGQTLIYSHSDPTDQVLNALGLTMADLFDEPKGVEYRYSDGRRVHRSPLKAFRQSGNTQGNALYRLERLADADPVYFVEGEKDVHALESLGVTATCIAMGAGKAHLFDLTPLHGKTVYVIRDMDEPGLNHAMDVHRLIGDKADTKLVEVAVGKDAADHVAAGHGITDMRIVDWPTPPDPVDEEFERAVADRRKYLRVQQEAKRRDAEDAAAATSSKLEVKSLGALLDQTFTYSWLVPDLLERGDRLVLTGSEGGGKSYLFRQIAICIAAGVHPFNLHQQIDAHRVLVIDAENTERQWHRAARYVTNLAARHGHADPRETIHVSAGRRLDLTTTADRNEVWQKIREHQPDILYIGPLYKLVPKAITTDDDAAPLIETLDGFRESGLALLMEAHAGKGRAVGGERDLAPRGSSALLGWPEFGFGLRPLEEDPNTAALVKWRGDREKRDWPTHIRRGIEGELPWERSFYS
ncbi:AAA family ATPase [Cnuibacter sp. UC19_7]|uniref:AAA family ATPase n=1 Tax=Cnuibacter sp. UC19_7 TaxID=3350166 RepID=UPI00366C2843